MTAALSFQRALRGRLAATSAVTSLVPAASILDRNERPAPSPSIILGEAQELPDGDLDRKRVRIVHTLHVWKREPSLEGAMTIAAAIRAAVHSDRLPLTAPHHCVGAAVTGIRTMRDPDGETSHAVVTVEAVVEEIAS